MSPNNAAAKQDLLLQEFAAELTPTTEELAATLGPTPKDTGSAAEPGAAVGTLNRNLDMIMRIPVSVQVVLGSATMPVASLAKLGRGAVIRLDRRVGEPVDVIVNGRVVARGEVVVLEEGGSRFGISLTEIVTASGPARAP
jgi:flagellar motor switch protein FliN/FliY